MVLSYFSAVTTRAASRMSLGIIEATSTQPGCAAFREMYFIPLLVCCRHYISHSAAQQGLFCSDIDPKLKLRRITNAALDVNKA